MSYFIGGKGALMPPSGTIDERETEFTYSPTDGMIRFNKSNGRLETYLSNHGWVNLAIEPNSPTELEIASGTIVSSNYFDPETVGGKSGTGYQGFELFTLGTNYYSKIRIIASGNQNAGGNIVKRVTKQEYSIVHDGINGVQLIPDVSISDINSINGGVSYNTPVEASNELFINYDVVTTNRLDEMYLRLENKESFDISVQVLGIVYEKDPFVDSRTIKGIIPDLGTVRLGTKRISSDKSFKFYVGVNDNDTISESFEVTGITNGSIIDYTVFNEINTGTIIDTSDISLALDSTGTYIELYGTNLLNDPVSYITKQL